MAGALDQATMERIARLQGVQLTPENANRISDFAAANPDILERYSMSTAAPRMDTGRNIRGGGGGVDNNAALLQLAIDRSIAKTDLPPQQQAPTPAPAPTPPRRDTTPQGRVTVGQPVLAAPPAQLPPGLPQGTPPPTPNTVQAEPGGGVVVVPEGQRNPLDMSPQNVTPGGDDSFLKWLIPSVLGTGVATALGLTRGATTPATPNAGLPVPVRTPQATYVGPMPRGTGVQGSNVTGTIENQVTPNIARITQPDPKITGPQTSTTTGSPEYTAEGQRRAEKYAKDYADVQAENAANAAQLQEQIRLRKAQQNTRELVKAARATLGQRGSK